MFLIPIPSPPNILAVLFYNLTVGYVFGLGLEGKVELTLGHTGIGAWGIMEGPVLALDD